jgi:hypothetical protein
LSTSFTLLIAWISLLSLPSNDAHHSSRKNCNGELTGFNSRRICGEHSRRPLSNSAMPKARCRTAYLIRRRLSFKTKPAPHCRAPQLQARPHAPPPHAPPAGQPQSQSPDRRIAGATAAVGSVRHLSHVTPPVPSFPSAPPSVPSNNVKRQNPPPPPTPTPTHVLLSFLSFVFCWILIVDRWQMMKERWRGWPAIRCHIYAL